ncbi:MAG: hypothetical protein NZT92_08555 [Abditibacteriales bacterium]|nr:hypothetical protein [Abditibacteriales bacterium]MDW8366005.1 hypothetical protein [Abditibacteriales bacterium]
MRIDEDGDGWTDDVNGDGHVDLNDSRFVRDVVRQLGREGKVRVGGVEFMGCATWAVAEMRRFV